MCHDLETFIVWLCVSGVFLEAVLAHGACTLCLEVHGYLVLSPGGL